MTKRQQPVSLGRVLRVALGYLNTACQDEHINQNSDIGKAIRTLEQGQRVLAEGGAVASRS